MKLSIITMFCDGHAYYVPKWVENVEKVVKIDHEIIIVDNSECQDLPELPNTKMIRAGRNIMQFAARRIGVENATGDYVFLVDCDDDILPITDFPWNQDLICFNYLAREPESDKDLICGEPYTLSYTASDGIFFDSAWKTACKNMVWNKFIKRDVLLRLYSKLPYFEISFMEDTLLCMFLLAEVESIRFEQKAFYRYYFGSGISTQTTYTNLTPLCRLFNGLETALNVFNQAFTKQAQEQRELQLFRFMPALSYTL